MFPDHRDSYCGVRDTAGVPIAVIWTTAGLDPVRAMELALRPPYMARWNYGSPSYEKLTAAHPQIAAFGAC